MPGSVYHGHAGLLTQSSRGCEAIRLGLPLGSCLGPLIDSYYSDSIRVETNWPVSGKHLDESGRPKPSIDIERLVMFSLTASHLRITESASCPYLLDPSTGHEVPHKVPLGLGLEGDQVHAHLSAVVPGSEPVPCSISQHLLITLPVKPIGRVLESCGSNLSLSLSTLLSYREAHLTPVTVRVDIIALAILREGDSDHLPSGSAGARS